MIDPPSVHPLPESGELEINLGETVDMACVAKGIPVPIISWKFKVIIIFFHLQLKFKRRDFLKVIYN